MLYRELGKTGIRVSEIGLGAEHLQGTSAENIAATIHTAMDAGVNIIDAFMSEPDVRVNIGKALGNRRKDMHIQGHIGSIWQDGQYAKSRDIDLCRKFFDDLLERLGTDYIDFGMMHFVDELEDLKTIEEGPVLEYAVKLKKEGRIRAIGMSTHNPAVAKAAAEHGWLEVLLFSINPAYDLLPENLKIDTLFDIDAFANDAYSGLDPARAALYAKCVEKGVGITVMKGLAAGMLLHEKSSPLGKAFTANQLISYALSRPAVSSVLTGCRTPEEMQGILRYTQASEEERDFASVLKDVKQFGAKGRCMYCNHCLPCPAGIDIASVNRYLDMTVFSDTPVATAAAHYKDLDRHASDCLECGACESRCPFDVQVIEKMNAANEKFGI